MKSKSYVISLLIAIGICLMLSFYIFYDVLAESNNILEVSSWVYILQNASIDDIINFRPDVVVMDYSKDGTEDTMYTAEEILLLKEKGIVPIVYISIGEAEDYRWYWNKNWYQNPPPWLGKENPNWHGNYAVKFWYPQWKNIVFSYIDKVIDQGFMGVYLDKVDIYQYWADEDNGEGEYYEESYTASLMSAFIKEISAYVRSRVPNFYVFIQNAEEIVDYDRNLLSVLDGIGVESLFYEMGKPVDYNTLINRISYLQIFRNRGKVVLVVEYLDDGKGLLGKRKNHILQAIARSLYHGYIPYIAHQDQELNGLNIIYPVQPLRRYPIGVDGWIYR